MRDKGGGFSQRSVWYSYDWHRPKVWNAGHLWSVHHEANQKTIPAEAVQGSNRNEQLLSRLNFEVTIAVAVWPEREEQDSWLLFRGNTLAQHFMRQVPPKSLNPRTGFVFQRRPHNKVQIIAQSWNPVQSKLRSCGVRLRRSLWIFSQRRTGKPQICAFGYSKVLERNFEVCVNICNIKLN